MGTFYYLYIMEIWKELSSKYIISSYGVIKKIKTNRLIKTQINRSGREVVKLNINSTKRKNYSVHRLVAITFLEALDGKDIINHKDGNPLNNKADNLEWCTQKENIHHSRKISRNGAVISVQKIKRLYETNTSLSKEEFYTLLINNAQ